MIEKSEAEVMKEALEAEHELAIASAVMTHVKSQLNDAESELRSDIDTALQPWRTKWREIIELEGAIRQ